MIRPSTFIEALLAPTAVFLTGLLAVAQLAIAGHITLQCWVGIGAAWAVGLTLCGMRRRGRLLPLLAHAPRQMRRLSRHDFGVHRQEEVSGGDEIPYEPQGFEEWMIKALSSRRLVLLHGERLSGKTRTAFEVLQRAFGRYQVLRPEIQPDAEGPPLAALLTSTSPWRRYILWLDDIAPLLDAGLDPRIIERWLATGRSRIAVATITPAALGRVRSSRTRAASALERAVQLPVEAVSELLSLGSVADRYRRAQRSRPQAAALMRVVATWELLGINAKPGTDRAAHVAGAAISSRVSEADVTWACSGTAPPLELRGDTLSPHPELVSVVDGEASEVVP